MTHPLNDWSPFSEALDSLEPVSGGFTNAKRGIVTLPTGERCFIKIGADPTTNEWARKEIKIYQTLHEHGFPHLPRLLAVNEDCTGFALEALEAKQGWEWETPWSDERLAATLNAMDDLAGLPMTLFDDDILAGDPDDLAVNPWLMPEVTDEAKVLLQEKLRSMQLNKLADEMPRLQVNFQFNSTKKQLVHYDVRRDNCAWNPILQQVKLVDWNWLHVGSREIDINALLVNVYKSGLDPRKNFSSRVDKDALMWLCGYWLSSSIKPGTNSMTNHEALRAYQFESAIAAYQLAN